MQCHSPCSSGSRWEHRQRAEWWGWGGGRWSTEEEEDIWITNLQLFTLQWMNFIFYLELFQSSGISFFNESRFRFQSTKMKIHTKMTWIKWEKIQSPCPADSGSRKQRQGSQQSPWAWRTLQQWWECSRWPWRASNHLKRRSQETHLVGSGEYRMTEHERKRKISSVSKYIFLPTSVKFY